MSKSLVRKIIRETPAPPPIFRLLKDLKTLDMNPYARNQTAQQMLKDHCDSQFTLDHEM